jgi:hypothetical protein
LRVVGPSWGMLVALETDAKSPELSESLQTHLAAAQEPPKRLLGRLEAPKWVSPLWGVALVCGWVWGNIDQKMRRVYEHTYTS